ncbi:hypothetical protein ACFGVR_17265 [Mucilaginibacter sp. AW1-3]
MKIGILSFVFSLLLVVSANAQMFGGKFEQGYYYDINGQKVEGLINENTSGKGPLPNEGYIIFKENDKAEKQNLSASMIRGFVVGADSFIVAHAPRLGAWSKYELDFLRVVINDSTRLYTITGSDRGKEGRSGSRPAISTGLGIGGGYGGGLGMGLSLGSGLFGGGGGSSHPVYYYGSGVGDMVEINKQNFVAAMSEVLAAEPEAVKKVMDKKYKLGDMDDLLKYYHKLREEHSNQ